MKGKINIKGREFKYDSYWYNNEDDVTIFELSQWTCAPDFLSRLFVLKLPVDHLGLMPDIIDSIRGMTQYAHKSVNIAYDGKRQKLEVALIGLGKEHLAEITDEHYRLINARNYRLEKIHKEKVAAQAKLAELDRKISKYY